MLKRSIFNQLPQKGQFTNAFGNEAEFNFPIALFKIESIFIQENFSIHCPLKNRQIFLARTWITASSNIYFGRRNDIDIRLRPHTAAIEICPGLPQPRAVFPGRHTKHLAELAVKAGRILIAHILGDLRD